MTVVERFARTVSHSAECKSFLLSMCIEAGESTTHSLSLGLEFGRREHAPIQQKSVALFCLRVPRMLDTCSAKSHAFSANPSFLPLRLFFFFFLEKMAGETGHQKSPNTLPAHLRLLVQHRQRNGAHPVDGVGASHPPLPLASSRDRESPCTAARHDGHPLTEPCCPRAAARTLASPQTTSRPPRRRGPRASHDRNAQSARDKFSPLSFSGHESSSIRPDAAWTRHPVSSH